MLNVSNTLLLPSLLPKELIRDIENDTAAETEKEKEQAMLATALLVANIVIEACKSWIKGDIKKLDPNPGDGGCQLRGYLLSLFCKDEQLTKEALQLKERVEQFKEALNQRKTDFCSGKELSCRKTFFKKQWTELSISKKMEFLLQCYLLAVVRAPYQTLPNGIVLTKSDSSLLSQLSKNISSAVLPKPRKKIVEVAQMQLSANSVELLRVEAEKLSCLRPEEKELVINMLSPKMCQVCTPDPQYEPKTFGCLFYEYKAILARLREQQGLVCFKSIVPGKQQPFWIFLRPQKPKEEFCLLSDEEALQLPATTPVVVFEGVVNKSYDKQKFSEKISQIGFTKLILALAAIEPPYDRKSQLADVKSPEAQEEILFYRQFAESINCQKDAKDPQVILDHVYCNTLKAEMRTKK